MGEFPVNCVVSGLPIEPGNPILFLLLTQSPYHKDVFASGACLFHDLWFARTPPIRGVYNGYGFIEHGPSTLFETIWLAGFQLDLIEGITARRVHEPITTSIGFDDLCCVSRDGGLFVKPNGAQRILQPNSPFKKQRGRLQVLPAFIRADVWDPIVTSMKSTVDLTEAFSRCLDLAQMGLGEPHFQLTAFMHAFFQPADVENSCFHQLFCSLFELFCLQSVLSHTGFCWQPSTSIGSRQADWALQTQLHTLFAKIAHLSHRRS